MLPYMQRVENYYCWTRMRSWHLPTWPCIPPHRYLHEASTRRGLVSGFTQKTIWLDTLKNVSQLGNMLTQAVWNVTAHTCQACDGLRPWSCTMAESTWHLAVLQGVHWVMVGITQVLFNRRGREVEHQGLGDFLIICEWNRSRQFNIAVPALRYVSYLITTCG